MGGRVFSALFSADGGDDGGGAAPNAISIADGMKQLGACAVCNYKLLYNYEYESPFVTSVEPIVQISSKRLRLF